MRRRTSFTLIELLLVIGIIAVVAGIVILAINPGKQLSSAQTVKRSSEMNQLEKALNQFMIDKGKLPDDPAKYPATKDDALPVCVLNPSSATSCIDVSDLVNTYIAAVPKDPLEPCSGVTGFAVYADKIGPHIVQKRDADLTSCPVGISWSGMSGSISNGQFTLAGDLDLQGKSLAINGNGSLNLNGHKVLNGTVTNNGTIVAQGNEQVTLGGADAGAWKIVGKSDGSVVDPTILNGKSITNLTIAPTVAGTVIKPTTALSVSGKLTVGDTAIFDATGADSTFGGAVSNNGAIILGDNAVHFNGGYDSANGQTVFVGTTLPSTLTYHDLTINGNATVGADATVKGTLTVNMGKTLTIASGKTLTAKGDVSIQGNVTGAGALDLGNGGQSVTVGATGSLSGQDATNLLTMRALQAWFLKYAGSSLAVSNLNLTNANNGSTGTVGCTSCGGTGNQGINSCGAGTIWNGSQCVAGNCMSDGNCNGYKCTVATHTCTASCAASTDCNSNGYVCNGTSCVAGNCTSSAQCAGGYACVNNVCKQSVIASVSLGFGASHAMAFKPDGSMLTWGLNTSGQLGDGTTQSTTTPTLLSTISGIVAAAGGQNYTVSIKGDGTVWSWGINQCGQLGDNSTTTRKSPVKAIDAIDPTGFLTGAKAVAAGYYHTIILKTDGSVWTMGCGNWWALGNGTKNDSHVPTRVIVGLPQNIVAVAGGSVTTVALDADGHVWSFGEGSSGQRGDGGWSASVAAVQAKFPDGTLLSGITAISAGQSHTLALKNDGTVWAWGLSSNGQLGNGNTSQNKSNPVQVIDPTDPTGYLTNVVGIVALGKASLALKNNGTVWSWGLSSLLGTNASVDSAVPAQVIDSSDPTGYLTGVAKISGAGSVANAYKSNGTIWSWGANGNGQLANGSTSPALVPVQSVIP